MTPLACFSLEPVIRLEPMTPALREEPGKGNGR